MDIAEEFSIIIDFIRFYFLIESMVSKLVSLHTAIENKTTYIKTLHRFMNLLRVDGHFVPWTIVLGHFV